MSTNRLRTLAKIAISILALACFASPAKATLDLADTPLFLTSSVPPNVVMTLDDSGSMCWGFAPGARSYNSTSRGPFTTPSIATGYGNGLYYNPRAPYTIPTRSDNPTKYTTSFTTAYLDGFSPLLGSADLSAHFSPPTGSYCNTGASSFATYNYTCTAAFGMNTRTCDAVFSPTGIGTSLSCRDTNFIRNSYSSTCDITFDHTNNNGGRNYIIANNCADTSAPPFQGLDPNSSVTIGNKSYTLTNSQNGSANGTTTIRVTQAVTDSSATSLTVTWTQGDDEIKCDRWSSSSSDFRSLSAGNSVTVSGGNNNNGTFTVTGRPDNDTIKVSSHVTAETGVRASFSVAGTASNNITVSNCGNNPFQGLSSGSVVGVSGTNSNNGDFTLTQNPSNSNRTLTVSQTVVDESVSNVLFSWPSSNANFVTVASCVDNNGDANDSPFGGLSQYDTVTIGGNAGSDVGTYTLASDPSNSDTTLTVSGTFPSTGVKTGVTFSWTSGNSATNVTGGSAAYYDLYYADLASVAGVTGAGKPNNCSPDNRANSSCYIRVTVGSNNDILYSGWGTAARSKQNFANWYSFYRTRALSLMSGATNAVSSFGDDEVRLAWQTINKCKSFTNDCLGYDNSMRPLTSSHRADFHNWLELFEPSGSTPLRSAMKRAGTYFTESGLDGPYVKDPGHNDSVYSYDGTTTELSCRKNFHVMFTDGYWNQDSGFSIGDGNVDKTSINSLPDGAGIFLAPKSPYSDDNSNNLADIAFYYWSSDLRSTLTNNISPYTVDKSTTPVSPYWNPRNDPATWQHMVNFTIGLGLSEAMGSDWGGNTYAGIYNDLLAGTDTWPTTGSDAAGNVYDLWHAALNSRGQFFSADSADAVQTAFQDIVDAIREGTPSSSAVATNSTSIQTNTLVYQASFDSSDWSGHLKAVSLITVNSLAKIGDLVWDAATYLPSPNVASELPDNATFASARKIYTINDATQTGYSFSTTDCASLSTNQQISLQGCNSGLINYLRGDSSGEIRFSTADPKTGYRDRTSTLLGDIINSDPAYVYSQDYGYATATALTSTEKSTYSAFIAAKIDTGRFPIVYVGGNDGMLHAFNASYDTNSGAGQEVFAFIPSGVYANLAGLANRTLVHKYMVDGAPTVGDIYTTAGWKTYLIGGLNAGGNSIFALDVTNPGSFSASDVKWEFSDPSGSANSTGLGQTFSRPQIARLMDGTWAAIFGNGYNSTTGKASLYVVNIQTGQLIKNLDTSGLDSNTAATNGLSTPVLYSENGVAVAAYAGDLHGNLWKFNLADTSPNNWSVVRLFAATTSSGTAQPITAPPSISSHSSGGVLVHFGTGSYLTQADTESKSVQSFYAIWDQPAATSSGTTPRVSRNVLQQQYIYIDSSNQHSSLVRETTNFTVNYPTQKGWFIDLLPYTGNSPSYVAGTPNGERVRYSPLIKYGRVIFVTLIPYADPCKAGGDSWLMELDATSGSRTTSSVFDFNSDGKFNTEDLLTGGNAASGVKLGDIGIGTTPTWIEVSESDNIDGSLTTKIGLATKVLTGSKGGLTSITNKGNETTSGGSTGPAQRIYWQQIL